MALLTPNLTSGSAINDGVRVGNVRGGSVYANTGTDQNPVWVSEAYPSLPLGIPLGLVYPYVITPLAANNANLFAESTVAAAGVLALTAGAGVTLDTTTYYGYTAYSFDVARTIEFSQNNLPNSVVFTISGWDMYGVKVVETVPLTNQQGAAVSNKAYKAIHTIQISAATGVGIIFIGTASEFGTPYLLGTNVVGFWNSGLDYAWNTGSNTLNFAGGTLPGDPTFPATASTGDVRGIYIPGSPADGVKTLTIKMFLPQADPIYTRGKTINPSLVYGVPQFAGGWL